MDSDEENDLLSLRAKNVAQLNQMFGSMFNQCGQICASMTTEVNKIKDRQKPKKKYRESFKFSGVIPTERRKSARIANNPPAFTYAALADIDNPRDEDYECDLEQIIREPKRRKSIGIRSGPISVVRAPEEITPQEIAQISKRSGHKSYSQHGTSCHQCRQKTLDTKTVCRSGYCIGVRGQFCGPCLKNRYGELAEKALMDPNWSCPPCRNLCNCSICRTRDGKRPTGILAPVVQQEGFCSVKDFLLSLAEKSIMPNRKRHIKNSEEAEFDDVVLNETSSGIIDTLINNYLEKIRRQSLMCTKDFVNGNVEHLLGFIDRSRVTSSFDDNAEELLGFEENLMNYHLICDDHILLRRFQ